MPLAEGEEGEALRWLLACQANAYLAVAGRPNLPLALSNVSADCFSIDYSPRSLALDPRTPRVAVGTKAGAVHVATWTSPRERPTAGAWNLLTLRPPRQTALPAIRGLAFLEPNLLAAGWGSGNFRVFDLGIRHSPWRDVEVQARGPIDDNQRWMRRFKCVVPLPQRAQEPSARNAFHPVALGLSPGSVLHLLWHNRSSNAYQAISKNLNELLEDWDPEWGSAVDAVLGRCFQRVGDRMEEVETLWFLTSAGFVARCNLLADGRLSVPSALKLEVRDYHPRFSSIDACAKGLLVRASQHVTFLRFHAGPSGPELPALQPTFWLTVPHARSCAAFYPGFPSASESATTRPDVDAPIDFRNPVWAIASTSRDELVWSRWYDDGKGQVDHPMVLPQRFPGVGGGALHIHCGGPDPSSAFLAFATQDHRLVILPALDRSACKAEIRRLSRTGTPDTEDGFWAWERHLRGGLAGLREIKARHPAAPSASEALSQDNLRALVSLLFAQWKDVQAPAGQAFPEEGHWLVVATLLQLLQRAQAYGPDLVCELAGEAFDHIARRRGEYDRTAGALWEDAEIARHHDQEHRRAGALWEEFGLLAGFLRKWIVRGRTYGANSVALHQLYKYNERCGRDLDAAVYLARLVERRVDRLWESNAPGATGRWSIWDVVCAPPMAGSAPDSPFILTSLTDGSLRATSGSGVALPWRQASAGADGLMLARLGISADGLILRHLEAAEFEQKHRHGPYARSLFVRCEEHRANQPVAATRQAGAAANQLGVPAKGPVYLIVFGLRGWRTAEHRSEETGEPDDARKPRLLALWVRPCLARSNEIGAPPEVRALEIVDVAWQSLSGEIYGFCEIGTDEGPRQMLAGTSGVWENRELPFVEIEISRWEPQGPRLRLIVRAPGLEAISTGRRSLLLAHDTPQPGTEYNPCWALVAQGGQTPRRVVWAGMQDGSIQRYEGQEPGFWKEGVADEAAKAGENRRRPAGTKVSAAVWSLRLIDEHYLAYGTGDGTVGMIEIGELQNRVRDRPPCHVIHTREPGPVCGLADFDDEGDRVLLALTEGGEVALFALHERTVVRPRGAGDPALPDRSVHLRGARLDDFSLGIGARALAQTGPRPLADGQADEDVWVPSFIVGAMDGTLYFYTLNLPRHTRRRRIATDKVLEELLAREQSPRTDAAGPPPVAGVVSKTTPRLASCVGAARGAAWLRVLELGELSMTKAALWYELRPTMPPPNAHWRDPVGSADRHLQGLQALTDEVYHRRPFSKEPAKMLWELASRTAHGVGKQLVPYFSGVQSDARFAELLACYRKLHTAIDDLCNRWIGLDQASEGQALADSFETSFDGLAVLALAVAGGGATLHELRAFLLRSVIQRRLYHSDPRVPHVTLRAINDALVTVMVCRGDRPGWGLCMRDVRDGKEAPGFYDLMILVGDLGERTAARISPEEPLYTELTRFFALGVLLLPESSLIVAQVLSESRLTEPGIDLAASVMHQLDHLKSYWPATSGDASTSEAFNPIALFQAYHDPTPAFHRHLGDAGERRGTALLAEAADAVVSEPAGRYTNVEFLREARTVFKAAVALASLSTESDDLVDDFTKGMPDPIYFQHSRRYFIKLVEKRQKIRDTVNKASAGGFSVAARGPIREAIQMCDEELRAMDQADIFHPQRRQYAELLGHWRDQLFERAEVAMKVLKTLDLFNRHVHRSSADTLMTGVLDLVMQSVPLSYDDILVHTPDERRWEEIFKGPTRQLIRQRLTGEGRLRSLFDCADRMVDATHLGGSLLTLAHAALVPTGVPLVISTVPIGELFQQIAAAGSERGLKVTWAASQGDRHQAAFDVPGTVAVWDVIAREAALNIEKHDQMTALYVDASEKRANQPGFIRIAGTQPFFKTLRKATQDQLATEDQESIAAKLQQMVQELSTPGLRMGEGSQGTGMGLTLVSRVAELCGLKAERGLRSLSEPSLNDARELPLCLEFTW